MVTTMRMQMVVMEVELYSLWLKIQLQEQEIFKQMVKMVLIPHQIIMMRPVVVVVVDLF